MTVNNPLISFLRRHIDISEKHSVLILKNTYVKEYTPLDYFFEKDQKNDRIAFVISGVFRSYFLDKKGNEITSNFIKENEIIGDTVSFQLNSDRTQETIYIQAETYCKVVVFSKDSRATTAFYEILNNKQKADAGKFDWGITTTQSYLPLDNSEFFNNNLLLLNNIINSNRQKTFLTFCNNDNLFMYR